MSEDIEAAVKHLLEIIALNAPAQVVKNEVELMLAKYADVRVAELEELRVMQLVACSTASMQNTERSAKDRIALDNPYSSTAYIDVCRAIDREIALKSRLSSSESDFAALTERFNAMGELWKKDKERLTEARALICHIWATGAEITDVIRRAEKWLGEKV